MRGCHLAFLFFFHRGIRKWYWFLCERSRCGSFGWFLAEFCKKWLNSESRVPKVLWMWFKVHSMRNIRLSFRNNKMKFKISRSGCFWLFWLIFAKNGWILNIGYQKCYECGLKSIRCGTYDFLSEITKWNSKYQDLAVFGCFG